RGAQAAVDAVVAGVAATGARLHRAIHGGSLAWRASPLRIQGMDEAESAVRAPIRRLLSGLLRRMVFEADAVPADYRSGSGPLCGYARCGRTVRLPRPWCRGHR